jgi:CubicO group peptidase (beta-lactamase class C family)
MRALLLVLLAACATTENAKPAGPQLPEQFDVAAVDAWIAGHLQDKGFIGLSVAVVKDGKVVLAKGYGKKSLTTGEAVTAETPFGVGSITKQFVAACVLLLAEEGKLSVDDKVAKYFSNLTRAGDITLYQLMTHTSGYPDYYPLDFTDRRMQKGISAEDLIQQYATGKLDFEPGTRYSYSNTGFIILGRVVEKVSGQPFGEFLQRRILDPLGMKHTMFDPDPTNPALATGYTSFALGSPEPAVAEPKQWNFTAGAIYSTAADLALWDMALAEGRVLKPESWSLMTTPVKLKDGRTWDYGCGIDIMRMHNETVFEHGGEVGGFLAETVMIPRTKMAVIAFSNADYASPNGIVGDVMALILRQPENVPHVDGPPPKEVAISMLHQMQAGKLDRANLGEEFNFYMSDEKLQKAAPRLAALGEPESVTVNRVAERGGMEVATIHFAFKTVAAYALLYRTPDGKVQEFQLFR